MTTRQAIKLLDVIAEMIEQEWYAPDEYLEAIGQAQDALRSFPTDEFAL